MAGGDMNSLNASVTLHFMHLQQSMFIIKPFHKTPKLNRCNEPIIFVPVFARALYSLAKIGEDLYLEAQKDGLALRSSSSSRSAFLCYLVKNVFK